MRNIFDYKDNLHEKDDILAILKWGEISDVEPEVSILMPVYNHPHFFKLALETAINQDYNGNYEIIILDNNQDDDIKGINAFEQIVIEKNCSKILYYKNEHNIGGVENYNRLPLLSHAEYFIFLHDDDELTVNCLSELLRLKKDKHLTKELIVPSMYIIDKQSRIIFSPKLLNYGALWKKYYKMNMYDWFLKSHTNGCGTLHNREAFIELGGYCTDYVPSADYAFYALYVYTYGGYMTKDALLKYRVAENDSINVYEKCIAMGYNIGSDILPKVGLPSLFLKRVLNAKKFVRLERCDVLFNGNVKRKSKIGDKLTMIVAIFVKILSHLIS